MKTSVEDNNEQTGCTKLGPEVGTSTILPAYSLANQQVGDVRALTYSIMTLPSNKINQLVFIECYVYSRHNTSCRGYGFRQADKELKFLLGETGKKYINK